MLHKILRETRKEYFKICPVKIYAIVGKYKNTKVRTMDSIGDFECEDKENLDREGLE